MSLSLPFCVCELGTLRDFKCFVAHSEFNIVFYALSVQKFRSKWSIYRIDACQKLYNFIFCKLHQFIMLGLMYAKSLPTRHLAMNMVRCILPICHFSCFLIRVSLCIRRVVLFFTSLNVCANIVVQFNFYLFIRNIEL